MLKNRRPSHSTVVAYLALIVALGLGTAWAAEQLDKNTVTSKAIKNGQVKPKDLGRNAVNTRKVRDGSLLGVDFATGQLPAGEQGPPGPTASAAVSRDANFLITAGFSAGMSTPITTKAQSRLLVTANLEAQDASADGAGELIRCQITVDSAPIGSPIQNDLPSTAVSGNRVIALTAGTEPRTAGTRTVALECNAGADNQIPMTSGNMTVVASGA